MGCSVNCSLGHEKAIPFDADPDIAGVGVVVAFLATAWFTLSLAISCYLISDCMPPDTMNGVDRLLDFLREWILKRFANKLPATSSLQEIMLMLGDLQLVTGTSMYIVAYIRHCSITQYHFKIAVLEGNTALSTYTAIAIMTTPLLNRSKFKRAWRWPWVMCICIASMIDALIIWDDSFLIDLNWGLPMQCAWKVIGHYSGTALFPLLQDLWLSLSAMGYTTAVYFPRLSTVNFLNRLENPFVIVSIWLYRRAYMIDSWAMARKSYVLKVLLALFSKILVLLTASSLLILFPIDEIMSSYGFQVLMSFTSISTNTFLLKAIRGKAIQNGVKGNEDSWGFGQLLPILLLAIPLFETIEIVLERAESKHGKRTKSHGSSARVIEPESTTVNPRLSSTNQCTSTTRTQHTGNEAQSTQTVTGPPRVDTEIGRHLVINKRRKDPSSRGSFLIVAREEGLDKLREYQYAEGKFGMSICTICCYLGYLSWFICWLAI